MKGFGKRCRILTGCILLIAMLIVTASAVPIENCPGGCTHQAAIGTTHYDTLLGSITAAENGSTVTLLSDVTVTSPLTIAKALTLDLGGKTLTANLSTPGQSAVRFIQDGTVQNGKISASTGSALLVSGCSVTIEKDALLEANSTDPVLCITANKERTAQVTLAGEIHGKEASALISAVSAEGSCQLQILKDAKLTALENTAIAFDCAGKLQIEGGSIQAKKDAISVNLIKDRTTELSISGGEIFSEEGEVIAFTLEEDAEAPKDFITGGTYQKLPTAYIPAYCKILQNTDGTYVVISDYLLTFAVNGGTGTMEPVKVPCGSSITLPQCSTASPAGMDFAGWEIGGTLYAPGDSYTPTADTTIVALWKAHVHTGGTATCLKKAVCSICGESYGKLGAHSLQYHNGYAATCTDSGMNAHSTCKLCGGCFVDGIKISASSLTMPALGHSWETTDAVPATCKTDGCLAYRQCKICSAMQVSGKTVTEEELLLPATGHTMETIAATQATCKDAGVQAHEHCTTCDLLFLKGTPVEAAQLTTALSSHVLSDWQQDAYYHWKTCVDCEEVFRQSEHRDSDLDGICDDCSCVMTVQKDSAVESGFSWLFLLPVIAAVAIAIPLALKKRKV